MNSSAKRIFLPLGAGLLGAVFLTGVYLGIVSLAESPKHALELFWQDKAFVIPIILGFGTQVGLYALLKKGLYTPIPVPNAALRLTLATSSAPAAARRSPHRARSATALSRPATNSAPTAARH